MLQGKKKRKMRVVIRLGHHVHLHENNTRHYQTMKLLTALQVQHSLKYLESQSVHFWPNFCGANIKIYTWE